MTLKGEIFSIFALIIRLEDKRELLYNYFKSRQMKYENLLSIRIEKKHSIPTEIKNIFMD